MSRREVRATYDRIAEHFAQTRAHAWEDVESFVESAPNGVVLDLACGNGRHAELFSDRGDRVVCADLSRPMLETARTRLESASIEFVQVDGAAIGLQRNTIDAAVYIAALHHLPTQSLRRQSLAELGRVLTAGGEGLVSVWATTHPTFDRTSGFDTTVDWTLPDGTVVDRFYHIYDPVEFDRDLEAASLTVVDRFESHGNCYAVVEGDGDG
ncbi:class I SAM-dependent methyltransferase [Halocatena halophila]|uniref:class I SAM-dependent methyltransferase n=1 Tax=Halocatena halophila TaxID=2814576 RepID=UPI002ED56E69